ncbi:MAG: FecR domain-containing protein [Bacteroidales bacterium]|nr:FecR domain-containing protein [Bacteroidales bacterium]
MKTKDKTIPVDTDKAWQQLHSRLESDGLLPERGESAPSVRRPVWLQLAATFLLLVAAGTIIWLWPGRNPKASMLAMSNTDSEQTLVKLLADGSVVYLAANATLAYPVEFAPGERRVNLQGEAFFEVEHQAAQPFRVELEMATIEVLGTSFNLKSLENNGFELLVEEGLVQVQFQKPLNEKVLVAPREMLVFSGETYQKISGTDLELTLWRQNRMHFKDESLENVLSVINRNYHSRLLVPDPLVASRLLTVTFFENDLPTIVELISLSMNLQAQLQPDSSIVFAAR